MKTKKKIISILMILVMITLSGCEWAGFESTVNDIKGQLTGVSFNCYFYDN